MKKVLTVFLAALLLISLLGVPVFAAENSEKEIAVKEAEIIKENGSYTLKVVVENLSEIGLSNVQCLIYSDEINEDDISFADSNIIGFKDSSYSVEVYGATMDEIAPLGEATFLFDVETCSNVHTDLGVLIGYQYKTDSVYAGGTYNEKNTNMVEFSSILKKADDDSMTDVVFNFLKQTGFSKIAQNWKVIVMFLIAFVLIYLAIVKKFEPLLLLPIAFGMLLTNLPGAEMYHPDLFAGGHVHWDMFSTIGAGLLDYLYLGIKLGIYPCLIFLGIGAMTDFGPLIANPKSLLLGAAAQLGIFITYFGATLLGFTSQQAGSIGIIGGADGPTAIFVSSMLAPELLGPIAVAAYSYMALVPFIQPPIMKALTTKKERRIVMKELRPVSKREKMIFPIAVTVFVALLVPSAAPLVGCLMLGNLMRESGVVDRIAKAAQNELMNIVTIFLGISVGATATADAFLNWSTLKILGMGIIAFSFGTAGGVLLAKLMNLFLKNKINPLIGSAGVSAVPMAARVSQSVGQKENPSNFLLMHAMGPNVAGVIGSAIAAGVLIALFG